MKSIHITSSSYSLLHPQAVNTELKELQRARPDMWEAETSYYGGVARRIVNPFHVIELIPLLKVCCVLLVDAMVSLLQFRAVAHLFSSTSTFLPPPRLVAQVGPVIGGLGYIVAILVQRKFPRLFAFAYFGAWLLRGWHGKVVGWLGALLWKVGVG